MILSNEQKGALFMLHAAWLRSQLEKADSSFRQQYIKGVFVDTTLCMYEQCAKENDVTEMMSELFEEPFAAAKLLEDMIDQTVTNRSLSKMRLSKQRHIGDVDKENKITKYNV